MPRRCSAHIRQPMYEPAIEQHRPHSEGLKFHPRDVASRLPASSAVESIGR